jgi:hypothetical protein
MSGSKRRKAEKYAASVAHDPEAVAGIIEALAKSDEGRKNFEAVLGLQIAHHPDLSNRPMVAMAVPSYKNMHGKMMTATHKMVAYSKQFCDVIQSPVLGSCVVHWARNQLIAEIMKGGQPFTHILYIDDDIVPEPDYLVRMLRHDKDVVGALCTRRTDPPVPNVRDFDEETQNFVQWRDPEQMIERALAGELSPEECLLPKAVGTGMMLISRKALDRIADYWVNCEYERDIVGASPEWVEKHSAVRSDYYKQHKDAFWFQFLNHPKGAGEYGEDISFCWKARQCGLGVFTDISLQPEHMGEYGYTALDFTPFRDKEQAQQRALKVPELLVVD